MHHIPESLSWSWHHLWVQYVHSALLMASTASLLEAPLPSAPHLPEEPMQLVRTLISAKEREQWTQQWLCVHCGKSGHFLASCPVKARAHQ